METESIFVPEPRNLPHSVDVALEEHFGTLRQDYFRVPYKIEIVQTSAE